jgi:hypothetical protein
MKKYLALSILLLIAVSSCNKGFLDLNDPTRVFSEDLYKDANGINLAVNGAYASLQDIYGRSATGGTGLYIFGDVASDNSTSVSTGAGIGDFEFFITAPENVNLLTMWRSMYKCIARCNTILDRIDAVTMDQALKDRYKAEVKFIRALTYFNAVRIWGGVPLITKELKTVNEALAYGRETEANVYALIEQDLKDAESATTGLPISYPAATTPTSGLGRATRGAAKALLGKVYLNQRKFDLCKAKLAELLPVGSNPYGYDLLPNFADVFSISNELNKEIIFSVRYSKTGLGTGSAFFNWFAPTESGSAIAKVGGSNGFNTPRKSLFNEYPKVLPSNPATALTTSLDKRRDASFGRFPLAVTNENAVTTYYSKKYVDDQMSIGLDADNDWIVIRYADVLLMYAEAENEINGPAIAKDYVNLVRRRAYGNTTGDLTAAQILNPASLRTAIETERKLELNMEGHRWFDLVRTDRAVQVMNAHFIADQIKIGTTVISIGANNKLFPIPLKEIQLNPKIIPNP